MQSIYSADFLLEIHNSECAYKWFNTPLWHCLYEFSTFWTEFSTLFNLSRAFYIMFVWKSIYCDLSFITHNKKCLVKKNKNSSRQGTVENLLQTAPKGQNGIHYIIYNFPGGVQYILLHTKARNGTPLIRRTAHRLRQAVPRDEKRRIC